MHFVCIKSLSNWVLIQIFFDTFLFILFYLLYVISLFIYQQKIHDEEYIIHNHFKPELNSLYNN